jgi:outer membrane biosynthesis protein TonB
MSERMMFLHFRHGYSEKMEASWNLYTEELESKETKPGSQHTENANSPAAAIVPAAPKGGSRPPQEPKDPKNVPEQPEQPEEPEKKEKTRKDKRKVGSGTSVDGDGVPGSNKKTKPPKKRVDDALELVAKEVKEYQTSTSAARAQVASIKSSDPKWSFGDNDFWLGNLEKLLKESEEIPQELLAFTHNDRATLKRSASEEQLTVLAGQFVDLVKPNNQKLAEKVQSLNETYNVVNKSKKPESKKPVPTSNAQKESGLPKPKKQKKADDGC